MHQVSRHPVALVLFGRRVPLSYDLGERGCYYILNFFIFISGVVRITAPIRLNLYCFYIINPTPKNMKSAEELRVEFCAIIIMHYDKDCLSRSSNLLNDTTHPAGMKILGHHAKIRDRLFTSPSPSRRNHIRRSNLRSRPNS
jgi:hypothetical protein